MQQQNSGKVRLRPDRCEICKDQRAVTWFDGKRMCSGCARVAAWQLELKG
jgi:hypothetical protein